MKSWGNWTHLQVIGSVEVVHEEFRGSGVPAVLKSILVGGAGVSRVPAYGPHDKSERKIKSAESRHDSSRRKCS